MSLVPLSPPELTKFRRRLLSWFASQKRDLPWRRIRDPYRIWISEIMLQQTRVAAVIPYYEKFLAKFPTVKSLAQARSETVLGHWAGLGYYSRARNLHRAAKEITSGHAGEFPRSHGAALALPGIGHYTAAAVLSIAHGAPLAVLDGNVARVIARLGAVPGDLRAPALWRDLQNTAQDLLTRRAAGDWNQAMMELGAMVCTPTTPRCGECPIAKWCQAQKLGVTDRIPEPRKKRATEQVTLAAAVFLDEEGRTLLVRQNGEAGALFSRMWQFPAVAATTEDPASDLAEYLREEFAYAINGSLKALKFARHTVTFRAIRLQPFVIHVDRLPPIEGSRAATLGKFSNLAVSNATRKIANAALADLAVSHDVKTNRWEPLD